MPVKDFEYLGDKDIYLDAACQSMRPQPVIDALVEYYTNYNACGGRAKYKWGLRTDDRVNETRGLVLKWLKLSSRDYFVSFTLNTTYGLNLILSQLRQDVVRKVMTSEIEHNSPFLSTMTFAEEAGVEREVMERMEDGSIDLSAYDFTGALVVVNCASNVDGRKLGNIRELVKAVHKAGGIVVIDAAQAMAHSSDVLWKTEADAICFSAHKMYAPSLGVMVVRKDLAPKMQTSFIGGGMVDDVTRDEYVLSADSPNNIHTKFEAGLQAWGEIIGFGAALKWLDKLPKEAHRRLERNVAKMYEFLSENPKIVLINAQPNPTMSFYVEGLDSHLLGGALGDAGLMVRTGYFCVHYYLDHVKGYPPLVRFSMGYHNSEEDIDRAIDILRKVC